MPTDGHITSFSQNLPILSDSQSIRHALSYRSYHAISENFIGAFKFYAASVNGIGDEDVRLSKRIHLKRTNLRGFEAGKVGPKDGEDFIGGNYAATMNFSSTIPQILQNSENIDFLFF